ncbi:MAG: galactokinase [Armatimonadetes bacterium]|nr:galactokinase [Armatimonadota bacterium]
MAGLESLVSRARGLFSERFGGSPEVVSVAPGRVNLIGEHTDYNEGFVFPAAIDRHVVVAARRADSASEVWSEGFKEAARFSVGEEREMAGWARFPCGVAWTLVRAGFEVRSEIEAVVASDLPVGSGLGSSAAIELAFAGLWNELDGLGLGGKELALLAQRCEHEFIGVKCGVMDQLASSLGRQGQAMLLDSRSLEVEYKPIPKGINIVLCDTGKGRSLGSTAYNERLAECQAVCRDLQVQSLRDATLDRLRGTYEDRSSVKYRRARHVLTENQRCVMFSEALDRSNYGAIGRLMEESHSSLRDDYEVSCAELDAMAESARLAPGCIGARMTGAGFGGACIALVEAGKAEEFASAAGAGYRKRTDGFEPAFLTCTAADGARLI